MHMPRAAEAFEGQGMRVYAAATGYRSATDRRADIFDWLPSAGGLETSRLALHELVGRLWYRIRY
jgi:uncharacterized SAM-binding protein YcdF (DUF218 family)